jgi:predicted RNA-binding protein with PUA-like domain
MACWLLKTEPDSFSLDDLAARPDGVEPWDGVRNYQARNYLRDALREGDEVFIYHSSCAVPAVVGVARVASPPRPDPTQFDRSSAGFDPKSDPAAPRWYLVDIRYERHLPRPVTLAELKARREEFTGLALLERPRLSVMPVVAAHRDRILALAGA